MPPCAHERFELQQLQWNLYSFSETWVEQALRNGYVFSHSLEYLVLYFFLLLGLLLIFWITFCFSLGTGFSPLSPTFVRHFEWFSELLNGVRLLALGVRTTQGARWRLGKTLRIGKCNTSRFTLRSQKMLIRWAIFSLFSELYDKSGEPDKNQESGRQHIKSGDSRLNREGWNVCRLIGSKKKVD